MRRNQVISKRKLISNIVGWPDYYISKRSRLYRYYPKRKVWMLLKGTLNRGRIYHILRDSNKHKRIQASRLVALAWVPNPENKPHVCHKDNNPCNNIHTNLYWGTQKENIQQCIRDKAKGYSNKELGEKYKLSKASISHYLNRSL